ncbi:MAG TPA: hypothetical protein VKF84_03235 [Candidatus Sulfotelmatobacter sp.]|nr:hypothetical protein [Candidatus Sulfotelmatobacter sp.]
MHGILRMVAMLLLFTVAAAVPGAQAMPPAAAPAGHATGCHDHGPASPVPASTRYQCCVNGHHAAVPTVSFSLRFLASQVCSLDGGDGPRLASLLSLNSALFVVPSNSPPGPAPLRI